MPWLVAQLRRLGLGKCVLQADGEPAQRAFIKDVIEEANRVSGLGVAGAHSPAYDHRANGDVERAIREVKGPDPRAPLRAAAESGRSAADEPGD